MEEMLYKLNFLLTLDYIFFFYWLMVLNGFILIQIFKRKQQKIKNSLTLYFLRFCYLHVAFVALHTSKFLENRNIPVFVHYKFKKF